MGFLRLWELVKYVTTPWAHLNLLILFFPSMRELPCTARRDTQLSHVCTLGSTTANSLSTKGPRSVVLSHPARKERTGLPRAPVWLLPILTYVLYPIALACTSRERTSQFPSVLHMKTSKT